MRLEPWYLYFVIAGLEVTHVFLMSHSTQLSRRHICGDGSFVELSRTQEAHLEQDWARLG